MVVGTGEFICRECGTVFKTPLVEFEATIKVIPASSCPQCGSKMLKPSLRTKLLYFNRLLD